MGDATAASRKRPNQPSSPNHLDRTAAPPGRSPREMPPRSPAMDRSTHASSWNERLVALALVAAVGLATQVVVERTLPDPHQDGIARTRPEDGLEPAPVQGAPNASLLSSGLGGERDAQNGAEQAGALSSLTAAELSTGPAASSDGPTRARRVRTPSRTRTRRYLPGLGSDPLLEAPYADPNWIAVGPPSSGWMDVAQPLRTTPEAAAEIPALLIPATTHLVAIVPANAAPIWLPLEVPKGFAIKVSDDGETLVLRDRDGEGDVILRRRPPRATDADGRELPTLYREGRGRGRIEIDPRGARPPIQLPAGEPSEPLPDRNWPADQLDGKSNDSPQEKKAASGAPSGEESSPLATGRTKDSPKAH